MDSSIKLIAWQKPLDQTVWDRHESMSSFVKLQHDVQHMDKDRGAQENCDIAGQRGTTSLIILVSVNIVWVF